VLRLRLITGPLLIVLLLGAVWLDERLAGSPLPEGLAGLVGRDAIPPGTVLLVVALIAITFAALEIAAVLRALGTRTSPALAVAAGVCGIILPWAAAMADRPLAAGAAIATVPPVLAAFALLAAVRGRRIPGATLAAAGTLVCFVYPALPLGLLLALRHEHSAWWLVGIIMSTKACDIGAYFTGRAIGRRKLIPWLSPGKTWEGLAGGVLLAGATGAGLAAASRGLPSPADHVPVLAGLGLGLLFGVAGQLGDLAMSLLKRDAGVKDSSTILPGMGGVMDVLDSPALVAPLAFWLLPLVAGG
jgi:phosphatidate cytidylyltransferase